MQNIIKAWLNVWPFAIAVVAGVLLGFTASNWFMWHTLEKLVALETALLSFHVLEEWFFPGGFYFGYNTMMRSRLPERYPLNRLSDMWTNSIGIICGCVFLLIGVTPMLAVVQLLLCIGEVLAHTAGGFFALKIFRTRGKRTIYNPGLATALAGYLPLAVCYFVSFATELSPTAAEVALGIAIFIALGVAALFLPEKICRSENTPYAFTWGRGYYEKFRNCQESEIKLPPPECLHN